MLAKSQGQGETQRLRNDTGGKGFLMKIELLLVPSWGQNALVRGMGHGSN